MRNLRRNGNYNYNSNDDHRCATTLAKCVVVGGAAVATYVAIEKLTEIISGNDEPPASPEEQTTEMWSALSGGDSFQ